MNDKVVARLFQLGMTLVSINLIILGAVCCSGVIGMGIGMMLIAVGAALVSGVFELEYFVRIREDRQAPVAENTEAHANAEPTTEQEAEHQPINLSSTLHISRTMPTHVNSVPAPQAPAYIYDLKSKTTLSWFDWVRFFCTKLDRSASATPSEAELTLRRKQN